MIRPAELIGPALLALALAAPARAAEITIDAHGLEPVGRTLYLAIFDSPELFDAEDSRKGVITTVDYPNAVVTATAPAMRLTFEVPDGTYGVKAFYDVDGDRVLDANFLGIPREPYGFSNNARGVLSAPTFEDAKFRVSGDSTIRIDLY